MGRNSQAKTLTFSEGLSSVKHKMVVKDTTQEAENNFESRKLWSC